ncbi:hypothetical protein DSCA_17500 [Desulfosarcina alkanivorans]|uniref:Methyl-accepting chemotaxis protein n=1 Tax=Desulfosarcina alkanivorans TaxID=571177 RepID=A0A5K7YIA7_9BACT|nr:hypothetical protein [Desulfosarcina alkanivorans]BBO67820.1 hypothetical protein DSCA_17500 [Desulfosarcina alkanivorans]
MKYGLRIKFLVPTLLLVVLFMGASAAVSYIESRNAMETEIIRQVNFIDDEASRGITEWLNRNTLDVDLMKTKNPAAGPCPAFQSTDLI